MEGGWKVVGRWQRTKDFPLEGGEGTKEGGGEQKNFKKDKGKVVEAKLIQFFISKLK